MAEIFYGKAVADGLMAEAKKRAESLKQKGVEPTLAIIRIGNDSGDIFYEHAAIEAAAEVGIEVKTFIYDITTPQFTLISKIEEINRDDSIHGVLLFRPLPEHMDESAVCEKLDPRKDVDGITSGSMSGVFTGSGYGYPPCTAQACIEVLDHYGVNLEGKKVTVIGRSLVVGKPVAMMALERNATVTICHSRTSAEDFKTAVGTADVVIAAVGKAKFIGADVCGKDQVILDVGINTDENGHMCGDVNYDEVEPVAAAITPVPGGIGSVTTALLMKQVVTAAEKIRQMI